MSTTLDPKERRYQRNLALITRVFDLTDEAVADKVGMSRQRVQARRVGESRIRPAEVEDFAKALEVPPNLFESDEDQVLHWLADHRFQRSATDRWPTQLTLVA